MGLTDDHLFGLVLDDCFHDSLGTLSVSLDSAFLRYSMCLHLIFMGPWALFMGPTTWKKNANLTLKLGPTALFTHLKIILLQCFQFSIINGIQ